MHELTPAERRVLEGLGRGDKHEVIAQDLAREAGRSRKLSTGTVAHLAWRARRKLHARTSTEAVVKAARRGLISSRSRQWS